ncbi:hypothetical protein [Prosthecobacter sp.]|jgi:hypothetical protein|uniref:hypothetical protein n=1 Tax=Prosthecobacter sp. TaxID=1965333 RepID=UPI0037C62565
MAATLDQVYSSACKLPLPDLGALVSQLLGELSQPLADFSDAELEAIADAREAEMDSDSALTISHEDMLAFIQSRSR